MNASDTTTDPTGEDPDGDNPNPDELFGLNEAVVVMIVVFVGVVALLIVSGWMVLAMGRAESVLNTATKDILNVLDSQLQVLDEDLVQPDFVADHRKFSVCKEVSFTSSKLEQVIVGDIPLPASVLAGISKGQPNSRAVMETTWWKREETQEVGQGSMGKIKRTGFHRQAKRHFPRAQRTPPLPTTVEDGGSLHLNSTTAV